MNSCTPLPPGNRCRKLYLWFWRTDGTAGCIAGSGAVSQTARKQTRINTNGLANLLHGRDVTPECRGCIDTISFSLNASNAQAYDAVCHSIYGLQAFPALLDFAKKAALAVPHVMFSVVDTIGPAEIARCQQLADACGIPLRVRAFIEEGQA